MMINNNLSRLFFMFIFIRSVKNHPKHKTGQTYPIHGQYSLPNQYVNGWSQKYYYDPTKHTRGYRSIYVAGKLKSNTVIGTKHPTWSKWSMWSKCSKSCAGGVRSRTRVCQGDKMPFKYKETAKKKGIKCNGIRREFDACNTQPCVSSYTLRLMKYKARLKQCAAYDKIPYMSDHYKWLPYLRDGFEECKLNCLAKNFKMFKSFGNVADGTVCGRNSGLHCKKGRCIKKQLQVINHTKDELKVSPTQRVNTTKKQSIYVVKPMTKPIQWTQIKRTFHIDKLKLTRRIKAFIIPIMAVNVSIEEKNPSKNRLILKTMRRNIINGGPILMKSRNVFFDGATMRYNAGETNEGKESIQIRGPLKRNLFVDILYNGSTTDIKYQYALPLENTNYLQQIPKRRYYNPGNLQHRQLQQQPYYQQNSPQRYQNLAFPLSPVHQPIKTRSFVNRGAPRIQTDGKKTTSEAKIIYKWQIGGFTNCSMPCGGGEQKVLYRCFEAKGTNMGKFVVDSKCGNSTKPNLAKRVCNARPCPYKWKAYPWSPCSRVCGIHRTKFRKVRCTQMRLIAGRILDTQVGVEFCQSLAKPTKTEKCGYKPCNFRWYSGLWSACTASCDYGTQSRDVHCKHNNGFRILDQNCDNAYRPNVTRTCLLKYCKVGWFASPWNECSSECGTGVQQRNVVCSSSAGDVVDERRCNNILKLAQQQTCQGIACRKGAWVTTEWTKCSNACGTGKQSRSVFCLAQENDNSLRVTRDARCSNEERPASIKSCVEQNCQPLWHTNQWDKCNCSQSLQFRYRVCLSTEKQKARGCMWSSRPSIKRDCSNQCHEHFYGTKDLLNSKNKSSVHTLEKESKDNNLDHRNLVKSSGNEKPTQLTQTSVVLPRNNEREGKINDQQKETVSYSPEKADVNSTLKRKIDRKTITTVGATRKTTKPKDEVTKSRPAVVHIASDKIKQTKTIIRQTTTPEATKMTTKPSTMTKTTTSTASAKPTTTTKITTTYTASPTVAKTAKPTKTVYSTKQAKVKTQKVLLRPLRPFVNRSQNKKCLLDLGQKRFCYVVKRHGLCKRARLKKMCCQTCSKS